MLWLSCCGSHFLDKTCTILQCPHAKIMLTFKVQQPEFALFKGEKTANKKAIEFHFGGDSCFQQFGCWNKDRPLPQKKKEREKKQSRQTKSLSQFNSVLLIIFLEHLLNQFFPLCTTTILVTTASLPHLSSVVYWALSV